MHSKCANVEMKTAIRVVVAHQHRVCQCMYNTQNIELYFCTINAMHRLLWFIRVVHRHIRVRNEMWKYDEHNKLRMHIANSIGEYTVGLVSLNLTISIAYWKFLVFGFSYDVCNCIRFEQSMYTNRLVVILKWDIIHGKSINIHTVWRTVPKVNGIRVRVRERDRRDERNEVWAALLKWHMQQTNSKWNTESVIHTKLKLN